VVVVEGDELPVEEPVADVVGASEDVSAAVDVGVSAAVLVVAAVEVVSICAAAKATSNSNRLKRTERFLKFLMVSS
jgi:hypothetical protein